MRAGTVVRATALVASCVVATTTALSAYLGDIPFDVSPVPMISDTFVHAPASASRAPASPRSRLLLVTTLTVRSFLRAFACEDGSRKTRRCGGARRTATRASAPPPRSRFWSSPP